MKPVWKDKCSNSTQASLHTGDTIFSAKFSEGMVLSLPVVVIALTV